MQPLGAEPRLEPAAGGRRPVQRQAGRPVERTGGDIDALAGADGIEMDDVFGAHEGGDEGRSRPGIDRLGRAKLGDAPLVEDDDAIGHHHGLLAVVGDVNGGDAEPLLQGADLVTHRQTDASVEVGQWLVEQKDVRIDRQGPPERDTLALATGQLRRLAGAEPFETEEGFHLGDTGGDCLAPPPLEAKAIANVARSGHVRPESVGLEHHGHAAFVGRQAGDVAIPDMDAASAREGEAGDGAKKRRLAAARGAEQGDELTLADREVDTFEHPRPAVAGVDAAKVEVGVVAHSSCALHSCASVPAVASVLASFDRRRSLQGNDRG